MKKLCICGYNTNLITCCTNEGTVTADTRAGGICYESIGTISLSSNIGNIVCPYAGGILGLASGETVENVYNLGTLGHEDNIYGYCGGIINYVKSLKPVSISNVYNAGVMTTTGSNGGVVGHAYIRNYAGTEHVAPVYSNCYYLNSTAVSGMPYAETDTTTAKSDGNMRKEAFVESLGSQFVYVPDKYPVLYWEAGVDVISLDKTTITFTEYGQQETITLDTTYADTPLWISSDTSIAQVDENGTVTAIGNGEAIIYCVCGNVRASCVVDVQYDYFLDATEVLLNVDEAKPVKIHSVNTNAEATVDAVFTSSDESIAQVTQNGIVSGVSGGEALITVTIGEITLTCPVTVIPTETTDVSVPILNTTEKEIYVGDSFVLLVNDYDGDVTWISSDTRIAVVTGTELQAEVNAYAEGKVTIYAMLENGATLICKLTVSENNIAKYKGDVNADGSFTVSDVVMLQKWLINASELTDWEAADFTNDKKINVFDLCIMKRELLK